MDWFGFHRSILALVRGIDHPPMSGVGTNSDLKAMDGTRTPAHVGGGTSGNTRNRGNRWFEMKWRHPADGKRNHREGLALSSMRVIHEQRDSRDGVMRDYHLVLLTTCVLSCNRYSL